MGEVRDSDVCLSFDITGWNVRSEIRHERWRMDEQRLAL